MGFCTCTLQWSNFDGVVVAEKTPLSSQYFTELQKFVVLQLGLVLVPVTQCSEAAGFLLELVRLYAVNTSAKVVFIGFCLLCLVSE